MMIVPTEAVPSQNLSCLLGNQTVNVALRQLATGLYMNVMVETRQIVGLVICEDLNLIVRDKYLGMLGDFVIYDVTDQGYDPDYTGLNTRFLLLYIEEWELNLIGAR